MTTGIVTIGMGEKYTEAAANLAISAAVFSCPTTLLCKKSDLRKMDKKTKKLFAEIKTLDDVKNYNEEGTPEYFWEYKKVVYDLTKDSYDSCAYVDADSIVVRDINEMFSIESNKKMHTPMGTDAPSDWGGIDKVARRAKKNCAYWPPKTLNGGFFLWQVSDLAESWFSEVKTLFKKFSPIRDEVIFSLAYASLNIKCDMSDTSIGIWDSPHIDYDLEKQTSLVIKRGYWNHTFHPYIFHFGGSNLSHRYYDALVAKVKRL